MPLTAPGANPRSISTCSATARGRRGHGSVRVDRAVEVPGRRGAAGCSTAAHYHRRLPGHGGGDPASDRTGDAGGAELERVGPRSASRGRRRTSSCRRRTTRWTVSWDEQPYAQRGDVRSWAAWVHLWRSSSGRSRPPAAGPRSFRPERVCAIGVARTGRRSPARRACAPGRVGLGAVPRARRTCAGDARSITVRWDPPFPAIYAWSGGVPSSSTANVDLSRVTDSAAGRCDAPRHRDPADLHASRLRNGYRGPRGSQRHDAAPPALGSR